MIVADTNLLCYLTIEGSQTEHARAVYQQDPAWVVPTLWRSEFLNVLTMSVRAQILTERRAQEAYQLAQSLVAGSEVDPEPFDVLKFALRLEVSAYDAQYIALASALGVVLVTGDRKLARRCPKHAVLMEVFALGGNGVAN